MATPLAAALAADILGYTRIWAHELPPRNAFETFRLVFKAMSKSVYGYKTLILQDGHNGQLRYCDRRPRFHEKVKHAMEARL